MRGGWRPGFAVVRGPAFFVACVKPLRMVRERLY